jgi:transcriptional regulator with XRE-family HTH domain
MPKSRHTVRYERLLQALRAARKEAGLTQMDVARHFRVYNSFVSKIESGERRLDVVELADLCRLYSIRLSAILKRPALNSQRGD